MCSSSEKCQVRTDRHSPARSSEKYQASPDGRNDFQPIKGSPNSNRLCHQETSAGAWGSAVRLMFLGPASRARATCETWDLHLSEPALRLAYSMVTRSCHWVEHP